MLDLKSELYNFPQINPNEFAEKSKNADDNVRNAVELYNKALESIQIGSEDIAIIGLKKAISIYPDFNEAKNLLGLCYIYVKEYKLAEEIFQKVANFESNGMIAANYLKQIGQIPFSELNNNNRKSTAHNSEGKSFKKVKRAKENKENKNKVKENRTKENRRSSNSQFPASKSNGDHEKYNRKLLMQSFAAGILLTGVLSIIVFVLVFSSMTKNSGTKQQSYLDSYKQLEQKFTKVNNDYNELKKLYDAANNEIYRYKVEEKLSEGENLISERKFEQAADLLLELKGEDLEEVHDKRRQQLLSSCIPQACQVVYNSGIQLFNSGNFKEAAIKLSKLINYDNNYMYLNYALYCLGKCYDSLNDPKAAVETFQILIDKYPGTDYAVWSQNRINDIKSRQR